VFDRGQADRPGLRDAVLLSECDGAIRELVIHYARDAHQVVGPTYRDFLRHLPSEVNVHVVCQELQAFEQLCHHVGETDCTLTPVVVHHPFTTWSRDRWLALAPARGTPIALLYPRGEDGSEVWAARAGDQRIAIDLAAACGATVAARRAEWYFDGGDFAADGETVFVRPAVLLRNVQRTVATREELLEQLARVFQRRVVVLRDAPDHHVAMYLMPVGGRTVLVGDPQLANRRLSEAGQQAVAEAYLPGGADFSQETQARFDAVARQCRDSGYRVVRIPLVPGRDGRTYITYVNAILDQCGDRRTVYMPVFSGVSILNDAAAETWTQLGYDVRSVDCSGCARHFGTLHCLVNVLRREPTGSRQPSGPES
jgi:hypothetical protein